MFATMAIKDSGSAANAMQVLSWSVLFPGMSICPAATDGSTIGFRRREIKCEVGKALSDRPERAVPQVAFQKRTVTLRCPLYIVSYVPVDTTSSIWNGGEVCLEIHGDSGVFEFRGMLKKYLHDGAKKIIIRATHNLTDHQADQFVEFWDSNDKSTNLTRERAEP
jgi:hypothetical protein